jgi:hypothetical protein
MTEYRDHIEHFSLLGSGWFSELTPENTWGNIEEGEKYLEKYWLSELKYDSFWKAIQQQIFNSTHVHLPNMVFKEEYMIIALKGGCLFLEKDFLQLQKNLLSIGEEYIIVIENTFDGNLEEPSFRLKYPSNITWKEITSGNFISSTILEHPHKEYFVFGSKSEWGKYSANDFHFPLDIIGFKDSNMNIFKNQFSQTDEELKEINEILPSDYIKKLG